MCIQYLYVLMMRIVYICYDLFVLFCVLVYVDISLFNVKTFIEECIVTSKLDHPNVLSLIGVSMNTEDGTLHMIMPFMHHGDVKSFVKTKRGNMIDFDRFPEVYTIERLRLIILIIYVYAHIEHTIHGLSWSSYMFYVVCYCT